MNALQQLLADYQNGGTFPDYAKIMALAERLHDEPQPVKYVDVAAVFNLIYKHTKNIVESLEKADDPAFEDYLNGGFSYLEQLHALITPHQIEQPEPARYVDVEKIKSLCRKAFNAGQTYWQQADSEYTSHHKKADITMDKFNDLLNEIQELLAPHELKRLSDEEVGELVGNYIDNERCLGDFVRLVEKKVRGEE